MLELRYLSIGIASVAGAATTNANTGGHFGCAVIAAYFLAKEFRLDAATVTALRMAMDTMIAGNPTFFPTSPESPPVVDGEQRIVAALEASIDRFTTIGHNVIFAALALKALRERGSAISEHEATGIAAVIRKMNEEGPPQEIFGMPVSTETTPDMVPYADERDLATTTIMEAMKLERVYPGGFQGYTCHLLTHGHALIVLERLGYRDLARRGHLPHRLQAAQLCVLHDWTEKRDPLEPLPFSPLEAAFWNHPFPHMWWGGHVFKYAYHHTSLLALVDPGLRARAIPKIARMYG